MVFLFKLINKKIKRKMSNTKFKGKEREGDIVSRSQIILITGLPKVGKNFLVREILKNPEIGHSLEILRIHSTKLFAVKSNYMNSVDYFHISEKDFSKMKKQGKFAESCTDPNGYHFGISFDEIDRVTSNGRIAIVSIGTEAVLALKVNFPENIHVISLLYTSKDCAVNNIFVQLQNEGVSHEEIKKIIDAVDSKLFKVTNPNLEITSIPGNPQSAESHLYRYIRTEMIDKKILSNIS